MLTKVSATVLGTVHLVTTWAVEERFCAGRADATMANTNIRSDKLTVIMARYVSGRMKKKMENVLKLRFLGISVISGRRITTGRTAGR